MKRRQCRVHPRFRRLIEKSISGANCEAVGRRRHAGIYWGDNLEQLKAMINMCVCGQNVVVSSGRSHQPLIRQVD
jgi:hypothetical protein